MAVANWLLRGTGKENEFYTCNQVLALDGRARFTLLTIVHIAPCIDWCRHCARFGNFTVICCLIQDVLSVNTHANYILRYNIHLHVIEGRNTCLGSGVTPSTEPVCFSRELALLHKHIIKAESIQPSSIPRYVCLYSLYLCWVQVLSLTLVGWYSLSIFLSLSWVHRHGHFEISCFATLGRRSCWRCRRPIHHCQGERVKSTDVKTVGSLM